MRLFRVAAVTVGVAASAALVIWFLRPTPIHFDHRRIVQALREILRAQDAYAAAHPGEGFAPTLAALGPTPGAGSLDAELAAGRRHGYRFDFVSGERDSSGRLRR